MKTVAGCQFTDFRAYPPPFYFRADLGSHLYEGSFASIHFWRGLCINKILTMPASLVDLGDMDKPSSLGMDSPSFLVATLDGEDQFTPLQAAIPS